MGMTGLVSPSGGREHVLPLAPDGQMMMVLMLLTWLFQLWYAMKQIGQPMLALLLLWLGFMSSGSVLAACGRATAATSHLGGRERLEA